MHVKGINQLDLNRENDLNKFSELCSGDKHIGGWFMFKGCADVVFFQRADRQITWLTGMCNGNPRGASFQSTTFDRVFDMMPERQKEHVVYMLDKLNR